MPLKIDTKNFLFKLNVEWKVEPSSKAYTNKEKIIEIELTEFNLIYRVSTSHILSVKAHLCIVEKKTVWNVFQDVF